MGRRRWDDVKRGDVDLEILIGHFEVANRAAGKSPRTVALAQRAARLVCWLRGSG